MQSAMPAEAFAHLGERIKGFAGGVGSVLFFENQDTLDALAKKTPAVQPLVVPWSNVVSGMAQYTGEKPFSACIWLDL